MHSPQPSPKERGRIRKNNFAWVYYNYFTKKNMFRIILLLFIFLHFSSTFFYSFVISYIPFKNSQNINIYNSYKVFEDPTFNDFMNNNFLTGTILNISWIWDISLEKTSFLTYSWVLLKLPYKVNHRFWEQLEILIPIIDDLWDIIQNDNIFDTIDYNHKQQIIKNGFSYLDFWVNYNKIKNENELNNIQYEQLRTIYLNKLYLIKRISSPNNIFLIR